MIRFFANANYDFIGYRKIAYVISALLVIPGLLLLLIQGPNYSIEFTGGTLVQVRANNDSIDVGDVRGALTRGGFTGAEINEFGARNEFVVRARLGETGDTTEAGAQRVAQAVTESLNSAFGAGSFTLQRREAVGPKVGAELRQKAVIAILLSFLAVLVYLAFRFEWRVSLAAVIATIYDIFATLAFIQYTRMEVSLIIVSGILTVIGYSLNDKIVVFDRLRENLHKYKRQDFAGILNRSVNETLPRTVLTGGTALTALATMAIFSGPVLRPFALVMIFGIVSGTFSSIYIGAPALLAIEQKWPGEDARGVKARVMPAGQLVPTADPPPVEPKRTSRKAPVES